MPQRRKTYTVQEKVAITAEYERDVPGNGIKAISIRHNIPVTTLRRWINQREHLLRLSRKREKRQLGGGGRKPSLPDLEDVLMDWIDDMNKQGFRVTDSGIQAKAKQLSESNTYDISIDFSTGWLRGFKGRKDLVSRRTTTTRVTPSDAATTCKEFIASVREFIAEKGIEARNVLNFDQTPRYFEYAAKSTITRRGTGSVPIRKGSSRHKRFTATFLISGEGTIYPAHLLFSGRKTKPTIQDGVLCDVNSTGMWSKTILDIYVENTILHRPESRLRNEPVLLLIDSYASHIKLAESHHLADRNVYVKIIPPNLTNLLQPLDVVVNKSFQSHYNNNYEDYKVRAARDPSMQTKAGNLKVGINSITLGVTVCVQMPSCFLVSQWVEDWRVGVDPEMVRRAFQVVGLGAEFTLNDLHTPLRILLESEHDETSFSSFQDMLVDDDEVFEEDEVFINQMLEVRNSGESVF